MNPGNFFSELKRRNVYKIAAAYAVAAWLLIQAASIFLPAFDAPAWMLKTCLIVLLLGFPVALALSWAFEITPEGIKRESDVEEGQSITPRTGRRIAGITVALAAIAGALLIFQLLRSRQNPAATQGAIPAKSIAVLPFNNLSDDKSNAYFADGIQDEILTRLAKIADLKVISRTSTQHFKSAPENLPEIARQLGVANVLEGSIQRSGDQVRITVQLINAFNDSHLWADVYDRKLTDIFTVESEIARTVAETLKAKLTGTAEQVLASKPTENPEAHQLYLKGRYFWNRRTEENIVTARGYFQQAIERDPSYALAYAGLSDCYGLMPIYGNGPPKEDIHRAIAAARRALELDDNLAEAHTSLGNAFVDDLQFAAAEVEFKRALELNPSYATAHQWFGECLQTQGRFDEALAQLKKAQELDPLSLIINAVYASVLGGTGHVDEALQQIHRTLEMDPNFSAGIFMLGEILEIKGQFKEAAAAYEKGLAILPRPMRKADLACVYARLGRMAEANTIRAAMADESAKGYVPAYPRALIEIACGEKDEGLRLLEKAFDDRSIQIGGNSGSLKIDPRLDPLRADPRFQKLLARFMGQPE
jgi:TolB-like protein/Tfp pilus assembly protein PilF